MTATWKEPLDTVIDILKADYDSSTKKGWNRADTDNIKPVILDIASEGPERGKRLDLQRHDYILCYETALNEEVPDLLYNFVTTRVNITGCTEVQQRKTRREIRLLLTVRCGDTRSKANA